MIFFTETALGVLKEATDPSDFVRVEVQGGGCSGLVYNLEVEPEARDDDIILEFDDLKVCMDPQSSFVLSETTVDYKTTFANSGFNFKNKQAAKTCGCGKSFSCG